MRILANYGYKTNGDTYSVTFETMGDVPADQAPTTVDTLFRLAREAVKRQIASEAPSQQPAVVVTVPRPQVVQALRGNGAARPTNGDRQRTIKVPSLPASHKQLALLRRLAEQKRVLLGDDCIDLTMGEASAKIDELMALPR